MIRRILFFVLMIGLLLYQSPGYAAYRMTPTQAFYYHAQRGDFQSIRLLMQNGYYIDIPDENGNTALCGSIYNHDYFTFTVLKRSGADITHSCVRSIPDQIKEQFSQGYTKWANGFRTNQFYMGPAREKTSETAVSSSEMEELALEAAAIVGGGALLVLVAGGGGKGGSGGGEDTPVKDPPIANCAEQNGSTCTTCENGYHNSIDSKTCYLDITNCEDYTDDICTTCKTGYHKSNDNKTCYKDIASCTTYLNDSCVICENGYHLSEDGKTCYSDITSCSSYVDDTCVMCEIGYHLSENSKICYPDITNCSTYLNDTCAVCNGGHHLSEDKKACYQDILNCSEYTNAVCSKCDNGFHKDSTGYECFPDVANCKTHSGGACSECNEGFHDNNGGQECLPNIANCKTYSGTTCSECETGFHDDNGGQECLPNIANCKTHSGTTCSECNPGFHDNNNGQSCLPDIANCKTYSGTTCSECETGFHDNNGGQECLPNIANCKTHSGTTCSECNPGFHAANDDKNCFQNIDNCKTYSGEICSECNPGFHESNEGQSCTSNIANCKTYSGTTCSECETGFHDNNGGQECLPNIANCKTYSGTTCSECETGFHAANDDKNCFQNIDNCKTYSGETCSECETGFHAANDDKNCFQNIENCDTYSGAVCSECKDGFHKSTDGATCYPNNITYCKTYVDQKCSACDSGYKPNADGTSCVVDGRVRWIGELYPSVRLLWADMGVEKGGTYTNTQDRVVSDYTSVDWYENDNYLEGDFEQQWLRNNIFCKENPNAEGCKKTTQKLYSPILYVGDPGESGGETTLKNSATIKHKKLEDTGNIYDVLIAGGNFENLATGIIGEENSTEYSEASVIGLDYGAAMHVNNSGKIYGDTSLYATGGGHITFVNSEGGIASSVNLTGNVQGQNNGTIKNLLLDLDNTGSFVNETNGTITNGVKLYRGKLVNNGLISGDPTDTSKGAVSVMGVSEITNTGTISGNVNVFKYIEVGTTNYETRASLIFTNEGTFNGKVIYNTIDGKWHEVTASDGKYTVENAGLITGDALDFDTYASQVSLLDGGVFSAYSLRGTLNVKAKTDGFSNEYVLEDAIQAEDTTDLKLKSASALFDAKLVSTSDTKHDVVMTMKDFGSVTDNTSLAQFLATNYALGNNEAFYNKLKSFGNMNALTDSLNKLTGKDMLSRFNFEDMTMMRELNYDMNEKLFNSKEQHFAVAGSVSPLAFKGDVGSNARYSLYNKRNGNTSIGLGVAFTDIRSDDDHSHNNRSESMYQLILPMGYKTHGFNLMTSPRIGYARGSYDRTGFDGSSYDGTIEKRVFGLMNEARYPMTVGKWKFEPAAEFNILGYQQKGHEDSKEFALKIQNQNTYSVEGGIGLYATREEDFGDNGTLRLTSGVVAYHEFADPYRLRVGMEGMNGDFTLRDEKRSDNRAVVRAGFNYDKEDLSLYGNLMSYIDKEVRSSAKTGVNWKF